MRSSFSFYLCFAVGFLCGACVPDLKDECGRVVDEKVAKLEMDFAACAAGLPSAVDRALELKLVELGCSRPDGGDWTCAGAAVCR